MAAYTVARVDGVVLMLDPRKLVTQGMALPENAVLMAADGGRIILADGTVLSLSAGQPATLMATGDVPELVNASPSAQVDPEIAALQAAIAAGQDPTEVQQAPAAGASSGGDGGSLSGGGGFSQPFDINRSGREQQTEYRYSAGFTDTDTTPTSSPAGFAGNTDADDGTTTPTDPNTGGGTTTPTDPNTGGGTTTPTDPNTGGGTTTPTDPDTGGGTTTPTDPNTGDGTTTPSDPNAGGGTTTPTDPNTGGGTTTPTDPNTGDGTTTPTDPNTGGGTTTPTDPNTGDGTTTPTDPNTGGGTTTPSDPNTGGDTTTPAVTISLDPVAEDDIVNADEARSSLIISGAAGGDAIAGDMVTITIGDHAYMTLVDESLSFSIAVPGSVLASSHTVIATISHAHDSGVSTATTSHAYTTSLEAPIVSISLEAIAGDDVLNASESGQSITLTGTAGGDAVAGDPVTISIGSQNYTTVVGMEGAFSISVPGSVLAQAEAVTAIVSHRDAAGNNGSATTSRGYTVDIVPPELLITLDTIAGDNVINAEEANQAVPVTGTVTGEYAAGDSVTLTVGQQSYTGVVNADGTFSINVPGSQLAGNDAIRAEVSHTDAAGNTGSANTASSYGVDTDVPVVTISLDTIAGDDVINAAEAGQDVAITGQAGGDAASGDAVTISVGGQSYTTTVAANGTFSVAVPGTVLATAGVNSVSASVSHTDAAGNTGSAETSRDYTVDTTPPALAIQLDTIAGDNVVNAEESGQNIPVTGSVTGEYAAGDTIILTVGQQTYTGAVNADGTFSIAVPGSQLATNNAITASVSHTDAAGNTGSANTATSYGVDTDVPVVTISLDTIAGDDVINAAEAGQEVAITGRAGGDAVAGDTVTISVGSQTYTTTVATNGTFSVAVPGSILATAGTNSVSASISHTDAAGNVGTATTDRGYSVDTTPPALMIALDTLAGDNVINAEEAGRDVPVTGTVMGEYAAGDLVTVTVGQQSYTGAVSGDGTFSISVPGSQLAQNNSMTVTVSHTDAAGNTGSANTATSYGVDTDAPVVTVSLDTIAGDDIINAAEAAQDVTVTGRAGGDAVTGDTVTVSVGGNSYTATVGQNGVFSVAVPGAVLAQSGTSNVSASVSHTDAAGNVGTATTDRGYSVDTTPPALTIALDTLAGDNVINADEAGRNIPVTGTVSGEYAAGDLVTVTVGQQNYTGAVNDDGTFSINVPGSQLAQNDAIRAEVSHTDAAGNTGSANTASSYSVDTDIPVVTISLYTIAGDDVINAAESGQSIPVTGTVTGEYAAGDLVTVTVGQQNYTGAVNGDGTFSINVPGSQLAQNDAIRAEISHTDAAGNVGSANTASSYGVDTDVPVVTISLNTIAGDDVINAAEAGQDVAITGQAGGDAVAGDTVTVNVGGQNYTTTVAQNGSFSIPIPGSALAQAGASSVSASVSHTDAAGNTGTATTDRGYSVDTTPPALMITLDTLAGDNVINAEEAGRDVPVTGTVSGEYAAGDLVTVTVGQQNYTGAVNGDGSFSINVPGSQLAQNDSITATVSHTDTAGNVGSANTATSYGVDTDAPVVTVSLDTIAGDDVINAAEAARDVTVTGRAGGDAVAGDVVTISVGSQTYTTTVGQNGAFSVAVPGSVLAGAGSGSVSAAVSHTDTAGNVGTATTDRSYSFDTTPPALAIQLDTIAGDNVVNAEESGQSIPVTGTVTGEYAAGDTVTLTVGQQTYTGAVNANGTFSINVPGSQLAQNGAIRAEASHTDAAGNTGSANTAISYGVDTNVPVVTISLNTIAGDDVINAAEAAQDVTVTGRAGGDAVTGDVVTISVGGQSYTTIVAANGTFSVAVPGAVLAQSGTSNVSATVSHTDAAGNVGTATTDRGYSVDTTPPALTIALDTLAGDNVINAEEANQTVPVTGTVTGEFAMGDIVTVTVGQQSYTGAVNGDGTFSINVPGSQLAQNSSMAVTVSHTDAAGNTGSANTATSYDVDTDAPVVTVSLDTLAGDDVINAAEAARDVTVTGQAGGDAVAGDTVTVNVGGQIYTTTVGQNGAFSVAVPGSVLASAGSNTVSASISHTDTAGNTGSAETSRDYTVDTTPPALTIALDTLAGDNVVNAEESGQSIPVTGSITGEYAAGDTVTLTVGQQTYNGAVNADGTFSIAVPGSQLAANNAITASVSHTDAAGNTGSANTATSYGVDTDIPVVTISLDTIAGDDVINASEAAQDVTVTGRAGGDAVTGDTVTVSVGGNSYTATVGQNGVFSVAVPGTVLATAGVNSVSATVSHTDAAGNVGTATIDRAYSVDTTPPALSITLDTIAGDNVVNAEESGQSIPVTGTVNGEYAAGDTVTLTVGQQTYTGAVNGDGTFSIAVPGSQLAANNAITASVSHTDAAGNVGSANTASSYGVDTDVPVVTISLDTIAGDDVINAAEAGQDVTITGQAGGDAVAGDTVTVNVGGQNYATTVGQNGSFSVAVPGSALAQAGANSVSASVSHTDNAGNTGSAETSRDYTVDTMPPALAIQLDTIAGDNVVNAEESGQSLPVTGSVTGEYAAGDTVTLTVGQQTYTGAVNANGTFSINVPGSQLAQNDAIRAEVSHTDVAGNTGSANTATSYDVDTDAPVVNISLDTIAGDDVINASEAGQDVAITGQVGGDAVTGDAVKISVGGQSYTTTVAANGTFSVAVPGAVLAQSGTSNVSASVSHTDAAGNVGTATTDRAYSVDTTPPALTITLDTLAGDNVINAEEAGRDVPVTGTVSGEYAAGDRVSLTVGNQSYTGSLNADGTFSIDVPGSQLAGNDAIRAEVSHTDTAGNTGSASTAASYGVDTVAGSSIWIATIAGDDVINAAEASGTITVSGKVNATWGGQNVDGDAEPGDRITLQVGDHIYEGVVRNDLTWSINVPGQDFLGGQQVIATVSGTDDAGNPFSSNATLPYSVDITPPALTITLDTLAGDNIINAEEAGRDVPITGTVSGEYSAGDLVTVTVGQQGYTGAVNSDGTFSIDVPGSQLAQNGSIVAVVSHTDTAGNTGSANTATSYGVDTDVPIVSISLDTIAGDDVINAVEAGQEVAITGQAGGDAVAGDTVTVNVGGQNYTTTVGQNGAFSVAVPGAVLAQAGTNTISASVSHTDAAGNTGTATTDRGYSVDTTPPVLAIQLDTIAGDNVVNADESGQNIPVTGSVSGEYAAGDLVTLTVGNQSYTGSLNADGTFSIAVPGSQLAASNSITASVSHIDAAGNTGSANTATSYGIDTNAPVVTISLDTIAGDDVINAAEAAQDVTITGRTGGDAVAGDVVTISVGGQSYTTTVAANGTFSVAVPGTVLATAGANGVSASVSHTDSAGNTGSASTSRDYAVDTTPPALSITIDTIAGDNVVNADESGQSIPVTGSVTGEYAAGDTVTLTVGQQSYSGAVNADGTFSINVPGSQLAQNDSITAAVSHTDAAGNTGSANTATSYGVDTNAPVVTISLDTIAGDDVINAAEAARDVTVIGRAGGDAVTGDAVTISVGGQSYTTTVAANGTFSVAVPGTVLATAGANSVSASVSHTDSAGNTGTATTDRGYSVDTTPPALTIALDTLAGDNVVNAEESGQSIPVTGTVTGEYAAGDRVSLTVGNQSYTGSLNADGTFSINVPGSQLAQNDSITASVSHTDAAGNTGSANTASSYGVNTDVPVVTISLDTLAGDDVINAAEAGQEVAITGRAGGDAVTGDTVTVSVGGNSYTTTVAPNGTFSVAVSGTVLATAGTNSVSASVSHTDSAGNTGSTSTSRDYAVDTTPPALTITLDTLAGDNVINAEEAGRDVPITGTVTGEYAAGDLVTVTVGQQTYTGAVNGDGTFSINVPGSQLAQNSSMAVTVSHIDAAGNTGSANTATSYGVDTDVPVVTISLDTIAGDNVINAEEAGRDVPITGTVSGEYAAGDLVTVTVGQQRYTGAVNGDGTFSINVPGSQLAGNDAIRAAVSHTDAAGNTGSANTATSYGVDTDAPVVTVSLDTIAGDDVINAAEAARDVTVTGRAGGDVVAGDTVIVNVGGQTYTTTVDQNGAFSVAVPGATLVSAGANTISASISHTDAAGNTGSATTDRAYSVDTTPPALTIALDTLAGDNVINAEEAGRDVPVTGTVSGEYAAGDRVSLTVGNQSYTGSLNADGTFSIDVPGSQLAGNDAIRAEVSHTDTAGNTGSASTAASYGVDTVAGSSIWIATIAGDDVINAAEARGTITVSGKVNATWGGQSVDGDAEPGDRITLQVGDHVYEGVVQNDLTWSINVPGQDFLGGQQVIATVSGTDDAGNPFSSNATLPYSVDTTPPTLTITLDTLAGDNVINAEEANQTVPVTGTVTGEYAGGDLVTVTVGQQTYTGAVNDDGTFSINVPGSQLAQNSSIVAAVSHTDAAGNTGSANTATSYGVDTDAPIVTVSLDTIAGDDVINAAEAAQDVTITGQAGGDAVAGDTVTVSVGGNSYTATVGQNGVFSMAVPGLVLTGTNIGSISASVSHTDPAGNVGSAETTRAYGVDVTPPSAVADTGTTQQEQILSVEANQGVLANDSDTGGSTTSLKVIAIDGNTDAVGQAVAGSNGGTFVLRADGSYQFAPGNTFNSLAAGEEATSRIHYTVSDGSGNVSVTTLTVTIIGTNDVPIISGQATGSVTEDRNVSGNNLTATGALTISDADTGQSSFNTGSVTFTGAGGSTNGVTTALGSLSIGANGAWTYTVDNARVQYLDAGQSRVETYTVKSADGSATQTITVTINGTADAPVIGGVATGAVTEDSNVNNGNLVTTGTLTVSDADAGQSSFQAGSATPIGTPLGSLTIGANGQWNYSVDNARVQYLAAGETKVEQFTVRTADGTPQTITVTINGTADAPVIGGVATGAATEDSNVNNGNLVTTGTLTVSDADAGQSSFQAGSATPVGTPLGNLTIGANGQWNYSVDNARVQYLAAGETKVEQFTVRTADGTPQTISVTITGTNDVPTIGGTATGSVTEDRNVSGNNLTATGALTISDADTGQSSFNTGSVTFTGAGGSTNGVTTALGSLSIGANGAWTYTVDNARVQYLDAGQSRVETYTVKSVDGSATQTITVTINGTADAPVIGGVATGAVTEDSNVNNGNLVTTGTFTVSDADAGQSSFQAGSATPVGTPLGSLTIGANGQWNYSVDNARVQYLAAGETKVEQFTVRTADGTPQTISVTITGTNDVPTISGQATGAVTEDSNVNNGNLVTTGTLTVSDADTGQSSFQTGSVTPVGTPLGSLTIGANGQWNYSVDNARVQYLAAGETKVEQFTVRTADGTPQTISVTIIGTNDVPTISGQATGAVTEDSNVNNGNLVTTGTLTVSDADAGQSSFQAGSATPVGTPLGSLTIGANGQWSYSVDNARVQYLAAGETKVEQFTVRTADGTPQTISVTITGTNDVPTIGGTATGSVTEDSNVSSGNLMTTGALTISDADAGQSAFQPGNATASSGTLGSLSITSSGSWTYSVSNASVQYLKAGETKVENFTVTTLDGTTRTISVSIVGTNELPEARDITVTGNEDPSPLIAVNLAGTDVDGSIASFQITGTGANGTFYSDAAGTQVISNGASIAASNNGATIYFKPAANWAGTTSLQYTATDNNGGKDPTPATATINVNAVADAPALTLSGNTANGAGLLRETFSINTLGNNGNGADPATMQAAIDRAGTPASSSNVTDISNASVTAGTGTHVSGLMYMEAGKTYAFSGGGDDSIRLLIGGNVVAQATWGGSGGNYAGSFKPTVSGYYTLDLYHHNQSGPGSYTINVGVNGGAASPLSTKSQVLMQDVSALDAASVNHSGLLGSDGNGNGYYQSYAMNEGDENSTIYLSRVAAAVTDTDGSESISRVQISGIPVGATISDGINSFTATQGATSQNVTGWNLNTLTVKPAANYDGTFNLVVTATSKESSNGDTANTSVTVPVTVHNVNDAPTAVADVASVSGQGVENIVYLSTVGGTLSTWNVTTGSQQGQTIRDGSGNVVSGLGDIAASNTPGRLYGVAYSNSAGGTMLYSINPLHSGTEARAVALGAITGAANLVSLTLMPSGQLLAASYTDGGLYAINPTTLVATKVATVGFNAGGDIKYVGDHLYASNQSGKVYDIALNSDGSIKTNSSGMATTTLVASMPNQVYGLADDGRGNLLIVTTDNRATPMNVDTNALGTPTTLTALGNSTLFGAAGGVGTATAGTPSATGNVLANDRDPDGDPISVVSINNGTAGSASAVTTGTTATIHGVYGTLTLDANGRYTYMLDPDRPTTRALLGGGKASDNFSYTISDGKGGTSTATLTVSVTGATFNQQPTAQGFTVGLTNRSIANDTVYIDFNNNARFNDRESGSALSIQITSLPTNGILYASGVAITHQDVLKGTVFDSNTITYNPNDQSRVERTGNWYSGYSNTTVEDKPLADSFGFAPLDGSRQPGESRTVTLAADGSGTSVNVVTGSNVSGTSGADLELGTSGNDILTGGDGNDLLFGYGGDDVLSGGSGNDRLFGSSGNDRLDGGTGTDRLVGGSGNDILTGGEGSDTFAWMRGDQGSASSPAIDRVTDFTRGSGGDVLDLSDLLDIGGSGSNAQDASLASQYLHFVKGEGSGAPGAASSNSSTLEIKTDGPGGGVTQKIVFSGVDFTTLGNSDTEIIKTLLDNGNLKTNLDG